MHVLCTGTSIPLPFPVPCEKYFEDPALRHGLKLSTKSVFCHGEPVTDVTGVAIRIPKKPWFFDIFQENGSPRQCAHWLAMTGLGELSAICGPRVGDVTAGGRKGRPYGRGGVMAARPACPSHVMANQ